MSRQTTRTIYVQMHTKFKHHQRVFSTVNLSSQSCVHLLYWAFTTRSIDPSRDLAFSQPSHGDYLSIPKSFCVQNDGRLTLFRRFGPSVGWLKASIYSMPTMRVLDEDNLTHVPMSLRARTLLHQIYGWHIHNQCNFKVYCNTYNLTGDL